MVDNAPPSRNPADEGSLAGVLSLVMDKFLSKTDDMLPAMVVSYDRETNLAQVKPMIMLVTTDNQRVPRAPIASVPVLQIGGGGYFINFPIKAGDMGWIKANDRDISLYMQTGGQTEANTKRKHSFEDGIFIPQIMKQTISSGDEENMVIQNIAGTVKISLGDTGISMSAPLFTITGNINTLGTITNNGVNIGSTHLHSGVQPGSGTTGGPV